MIKANELRIGNIVLNQDGKEEIWTIECFKTLTEHPHLASVWSYIPLTEELLLRFGFDKKTGITFRKDNYVLVFNNDEHCFSFGIIFLDGTPSTWFNKIKYVHQLQNLFHSLTGEELTLKK